ncbi:Coiled-coil domain-containing protein 30 Prefoldin subunit 6-like protein [Channa argus]|uniref:Coiled-coil domain-containing protein 30 Prefoldin subunit 6-like protein n=1 Tax=Channa argus TaxID=215402 RepID=A0A6G1Q3S5_CHAAH|nr:Coiled-coil domain-containing protein 30 Prefoldin subunit 6-like protein [Channa argus]
MDNEEVTTESDQICTRLQEDRLPPGTTSQDDQYEQLALVSSQEDLRKMGLASPTAQVAYLLRERITLQEKLKAAETQLERRGLTGNFREVLQHEYSDHMMEEKLRQQKEDMLKSIDDMTKAHYEEVSQERMEHQRLERDLEEVSGNLLMAQQDIHRLANELVAAKNNIYPTESELQKAMRDLDDMMKKLAELQVNDTIKLHQAKEQNNRLDAENRALRERVCTLEFEKKALLDQLAISDAGQDVVADQSMSGEPLNNLCILSAPVMDQENKPEILSLNEQLSSMKQPLSKSEDQPGSTSEERELHNEEEKSIDLKRQNNVLEHEYFKLCEQLQQAQAKLTEVEQSVHIQAAELENNQQKMSDLQLEMARNSTNCSAFANLQKDLQADRSKLTAVDKRVLELQHQLKSVQHQLRVEEARAGESICMERDNKYLSDLLSAMRAQKQEEDMSRKLLEQHNKDLQEQVCSLVLTESSLTRTNAQLSNRAHQLHTHLGILQTELITEREQSRNSQNSIGRLQEELEDSQQECDRLHRKLQQVLLQLDTNARKKLQAKQVLLKAIAKRNQTIQKLENDLVLALVLSQKEKERINAVMEVNEELLQEKRELMRKISRAEEIASSSVMKAATAQHGVSLLEVENRQLQDRILKLCNQTRLYLLLFCLAPVLLSHPQTPGYCSVGLPCNQTVSSVMPASSRPQPSLTACREFLVNLVLVSLCPCPMTC